MTFLNKNNLILVLALCFSTACSDKGLFQNLGPDEDGVVSIEIPSEGDGEKFEIDETPLRQENKLSAEERSLVNQWHEGEIDKVSFVVADAKQKTLLRSYYSDVPQRLASVSKISTALGALENVRNVEVPKVQDMLKISNNGEASRYVRLAAKAIDQVVIGSRHYTQRSRCPDEFLNDKPAADSVFKWLQSELPNVDWDGASLNDGAGCHYDNFMTPLQTIKILQYADRKGAVFDGHPFEDLLSINGVDGTWKNRNPEHKGYIYAKTGTLNPNGNLAGYFYANRGGQFHKYYFAIFVQKKGGGSHSTRARKLMESFMHYWINYYSVESGEPIKAF